MSQARLRKAAPGLLRAAKAALSMLLDGAETDGNVRTRVVQDLAKAIEAAEPEISAGEIRLVMTHLTYDTLRQEIMSGAGDDDTAARLKSAIRNGLRTTKLRSYLTLPLDRQALQRLRSVLDRASHIKQTRRAFERIVAQVDDEVLNKSPLIHLAETAL